MKKICLTALLLAVAGCSQSTGETGTTANADASSSEYAEPTSLTGDGGYTTEDEAPNFGLASLLQFSSDVAALDVDIDPADGEQVFYVRLVWGNLKLNRRGRDDLGVTPLDWTGSLTVDGNAEAHLAATILFDSDQETVVREDDPQLVQWISRTGPHIDGILVKVIYLPDPAASAPTLVFSAAALAEPIAIGLNELDQYNHIEVIDGDGHGVAVSALRVDDTACPEGFLQGKYHARDDEADGGIFRGGVLTHEGRLLGHMRGHYGVDDAGNAVLVGKYVTTAGRFAGLLHGTHGDGSFEGTWENRAGTVNGTFDGRYVLGENVDGGFYQGIWTETCEVSLAPSAVAPSF